MSILRDETLNMLIAGRDTVCIYVASFATLTKLSRQLVS